MTYDCPIEDACDRTFEASEQVAYHVRFDHGLRFPTDQTARDDLADLGVETPGFPWHKRWSERIPSLRPRKVA